MNSILPVSSVAITKWKCLPKLQKRPSFIISGRFYYSFASLSQGKTDGYSTNSLGFP